VLRLATIKIWLPALALLGLLAPLLTLIAGTAALQPAASGAALADIPPTYYALYVQAGNDYDTDWFVLAGIGKVETNHGRSKLPGVRSGVNEYGCCAGPMQFAVSEAAGCRVCVGDTWGAYGIDGNNDGRRNVYDPNDAIPGAANYTRANGAPDDWRSALWRYNQSSAYFTEVMHWASIYRASSEASAAITSATAQQLVAHPNITWQGSCQRTDVLTGQLDPIVMTALATIAARHRIVVTSLKCDHSRYTSSGNLSNHGIGRAVDIGKVDNDLCYGSPFDACGRLVSSFSQRRDALTPTESIYCFDPDPSSSGTGSWAAADHCDHWHLGYRANPKLFHQMKDTRGSL
jgi:hypothetical protein